MNESFLWVEKYRPKTIEDTILPEALKKTFQQFVDQKNIPNLLLSGGPGIGKTTVARAMLEELGCDYIMINASLNGNIDTLRTTIHNFASSVSFSGGRKYVILDEADYLGHIVQPALRNFMEEFSANCGFILTCNYVNKIIEPLQSRCSVVNFKIGKEDKAAIAVQFLKRSTEILTKEKIPYEKQVIAEVIKKHFPDWRRCINELQRYSATGKIDTGILTNFQETSLKELLGLMKAKDFSNLRKWIAEHSDMDSASFYRKLYDVSLTTFTPAGAAQLVLILGKYQYQEAFVADKEINTAAMCVEIMLECEFR